MKTTMIAGLVAAALLGLAGCQSSKTSSNMGTMGEKSECSKTCTEKAACTKDATGNMGAVSGTKSECCKSKAATGNMGAVSEKKEGCCASKTTCTEKKAN